MESNPVPATLKRPASIAARLAMLTSGLLLSAAVSAQANWPEDAALSDHAAMDDTSTLPSYLKRPLLIDSAIGADPAPDWGGQPLDVSTRVLPVLRSNDGRIEALLFIDGEQDPLSLNPIERLLRDGSKTVSMGDQGIRTGLRVRNGDRLTLGADLGRSRSAGMALLCNEDIGLATTLSTLSQHCLLAQLGGEQDPLSSFGRRQNTEQHLSASLALADRGLDLSFGLSWLQSDPLPTTAFDTSSATLGSTGLLYPSFDGTEPGQFGLRSEALGVRGLLDLGSQRWLSLDGQVSRTRIDRGVIDSLMPSEWNSGRLGFGMGIGDFSGRITGRVVDVSGSDALWGGLDIGFSWRTPWRAALTIGAKNVVSRGNKTWPQENTQALDEAQSRIPYVQYQQDL